MVETGRNYFYSKNRPRRENVNFFGALSYVGENFGGRQDESLQFEKEDKEIRE